MVSFGEHTLRAAKVDHKAIALPLRQTLSQGLQETLDTNLPLSRRLTTSVAGRL